MVPALRFCTATVLVGLFTVVEFNSLRSCQENTNLSSEKRVQNQVLHFEKKEAQFTRVVWVQRPPRGHLNKQAIPPRLPPHRETQKQGWEEGGPWAPHHLSGKALMKVSARNLRSLLQALSSVGMGTVSLVCRLSLSTVPLPQPLLLCLDWPQHPLHLLFPICR